MSAWYELIGYGVECLECSIGCMLSGAHEGF